ncbi:MAG TPA: chorismate synthase [Acidobacteriota bacterium]|jgi:chorismate synthase|nr:chorismate synthase [Acidobacteriota bacterium]
MVRFLTAGESHGRGLVVVLEGMPAGVPFDVNAIHYDLKRRQGGYGRGGRMKIESDQIDLVSGVRFGLTIGSPISFIIWNKDWQNWQEAMSVLEDIPPEKHRAVTRPRPGHADLTGALKYNFRDIRNVLERSSARETTARVAAGAICKLLLEPFGILFYSHTVSIQKVEVKPEVIPAFDDQIRQKIENSPVRCMDPEAEKHMIEIIDQAIKEGDSVGGSFEVRVCGVPPGLGSYVHWDRKLDGRLAQAMLSINAVKGVEVGSVPDRAERTGIAFHDEIFYDNESRRFHRGSNRAGGIEGGMTTGEDIVIRVHIKPIPTLRRPLRSVDIQSKEAFDAVYERSDTCVVPAAGVIGEAMAALVLACAFLEKFGGDSLEEVTRNYRGYCEQLENF